ncbi:hypothetical protein V1289_008538 [Bradyrhizobium sp. AZCC 2289]
MMVKWFGMLPSVISEKIEVIPTGAPAGRLRSVQGILETRQLAPYRIRTFNLSSDSKFCR